LVCAINCEETKTSIMLTKNDLIICMNCMEINVCGVESCSCAFYTLYNCGSVRK